MKQAEHPMGCGAKQMTVCCSRTRLELLLPVHSKLRVATFLDSRDTAVNKINKVLDLMELTF